MTILATLNLKHTFIITHNWVFPRHNGCNIQDPEIIFILYLYYFYIISILFLYIFYFLLWTFWLSSKHSCWPVKTNHPWQLLFFSLRCTSHMAYPPPSDGTHRTSRWSEASKGPFDFDDLQGVWFLAESSAKVVAGWCVENSPMVRESEYSEWSKLVVLGVRWCHGRDRWTSIPVSWESKGTLFLEGGKRGIVTLGWGKTLTLRFLWSFIEVEQLHDGVVDWVNIFEGCLWKTTTWQFCWWPVWDGEFMWPFQRRIVTSN